MKLDEVPRSRQQPCFVDSSVSRRTISVSSTKASWSPRQLDAGGVLVCAVQIVEADVDRVDLMADNPTLGIDPIEECLERCLGTAVAVRDPGRLECIEVGATTPALMVVSATPGNWLAGDRRRRRVTGPERFRQGRHT